VNCSGDARQILGPQRGKPALQEDHKIAKQPAQGSVENRSPRGIEHWRNIVERIPRQKDINPIHGSSVDFDSLAQRPKKWLAGTGG